MATSSDPNSTLPDWNDLYGHNQASASAAAAAGINISSMTSMSMPDLTATSGSGSPPGRIGKSPRRRSRASRRAPVTLLNTDTSNFRAMVQQFTGIPSSSSSSGAYTSGITGSGGPTISFSTPNINTMRPSGGGVMSFAGGGQPQQYQYQYQSRQPPFQEQIYHSRQQQQQQQQYDEYGAGENNNNNNMFIERAGAGGGGGGGSGGGGYHDMHVNNEGIFDTNHAAHSATNIHLRAHDHRYFG